jgi:hypothetical protein
MHNHRDNPKPNITDKTKSEASKKTILLKTLLVRYPWLMFVGLLGIPVIVSIFSYYQIVYVGYTPQIKPEQPAEVISQQNITTSSNNGNPTPLWLMFAIALSCASGCLVIYFLLKLPQR